ncbi:MAG: MFS transporter [Gammaproteobacteria bacterium]
MSLPRARLAAYCTLAAPLAMLTLPVYVHVPKLYAEHYGLGLATQGVLLVAARALDAFVDPLLGLASDRARARGLDRRLFLLGGAPLLALAAWGLFAPPAAVLPHVATWFFAMLVLVYSALALVQVSHYAQGAELTLDATERTRVTALRETFALAGVLAGAALPTWLTGTHGATSGYAWFALLTCGALAIGALACALGAPPAVAPPPRAAALDYASLLRPLKVREARRLYALQLVNGVANAVPATVVLFFVEDQIGRPALAGAFLGAYFLAGALSMPLWPWLARRIGKPRAWLCGMLGAIAAFAWALLLGPGDVGPFFAVCLLSGITLGADLALPPALLADAIDGERLRGLGYPAGAWFGLWALVNKLALALAAGLALPLLTAGGYALGQGATVALPLVYALLPCVLKALTALWLWRTFTTPRSLTLDATPCP